MHIIGLADNFSTHPNADDAMPHDVEGQRLDNTATDATSNDPIVSNTCSGHPVESAPNVPTQHPSTGNNRFFDEANDEITETCGIISVADNIYSINVFVPPRRPSSSSLLASTHVRHHTLFHSDRSPRAPNSSDDILPNSSFLRRSHSTGTATSSNLYLTLHQHQYTYIDGTSVSGFSADYLATTEEHSNISCTSEDISIDESSRDSVLNLVSKPLSPDPLLPLHKTPSPPFSSQEDAPRTISSPSPSTSVSRDDPAQMVSEYSPEAVPPCPASPPRDVWYDYDEELEKVGFSSLPSDHACSVAFNSIRKGLFQYLGDHLPDYFCTMVNVRAYGESFIPSLLICTSKPSNYPQHFTIPSEFKIPNSVTVYAIGEYDDFKKKKKENPPCLDNVVFRDRVRSGSSISSTTTAGTVGLFMRKLNHRSNSSTSNSSSNIVFPDTAITVTTTTTDIVATSSISHESSSSTTCSAQNSSDSLSTAMSSIVLDPTMNDGDTNIKVIGVTVGHMFNDCMDDTPVVMQPAHVDYEQILKDLRVKLRKIQERRDRACQKQTREKIDKELLDAKLFIAELESHTEFEFGLLDRFEDVAMDYKDRRCICDYAIFNVEWRFPVHQDYDFDTPTDGKLGSMEWAQFNGIGEVTYDQCVRKTGAQSGLSFGVVGGCIAGAKCFDKPWEEETEEFWVVAERCWKEAQFADPGDSGSLIITNEGKGVAIVVGAYEITQVQLITDEKGIIDIQYMLDHRDEDGSVRIEDVWMHRLHGRGIIIVESLPMILSKTGLEEYEVIIDM